jgi:hypothetical protein
MIRIIRIIGLNLSIHLCIVFNILMEGLIILSVKSL